MTDAAAAAAEAARYGDPRVVRVLGPNAGPFTGDGTNTWLVGARSLAVVDPGPDDPEHIAAILAAAAGRPITHILSTHAHRDHVAAVATLKRATGAVVVAMPRAADDPLRGRAGAHSPSGGDFVDFEVPIDLPAADGDVMETGDVTMEAIHTPGHAPDHLCFSLRGTGVLFTGDHVMGWSTSVIAPPEGHMGRYLSSLERMVTRPETTYLPGHGAPIDNGPRTARTYLLHRQLREQAILDALRKGAGTANAIAALVYEGVAPAIWNAAVLSVQAHLELLNEKGLVTYASPLTSERSLALSSSPDAAS